MASSKIQNEELQRMDGARGQDQVLSPTEGTLRSDSEKEQGMRARDIIYWVTTTQYLLFVRIYIAALNYL